MANDKGKIEPGKAYTEIVYRPLADLHPHPKNPRKATEAAIKKLAESIKNNPAFFEARPILLSDRTGELVIISGEQRSKAAKLLGMEFVPTILISGLSEEREEYILVNENTHAGVWDEEKLATWGKDQLKEWGVEGVKWPKLAAEAKEDDFDPDKKVKARCKRGDIWKLGNHRLMCGDSTNADDIQQLIGGGQIDMCFTSPPYNANHMDIPASAERGGGIQKSTQKKYLADNDNRTDEEYQDFLETNVGLMIDCCNEVFYNIGVGAGSKRSIVKLLNTFIDSFKDFLYWEKTNPMPVIAKGVISSSVELIVAFGKNNSRGFLNFDNRLFHGVINGQSAAATNEYADIHKATFPVYLPATMIENFCPKNGTIIDCFCGTGTTIIAAEQLGRCCFGMELEPHYCDVIIDRWEKFTGQKAVKIQ